MAAPAPFDEPRFLSLLGDLDPHESHHQGAERLRHMVKAGALSPTSVVDDPAAFFAAHRALADKAFSAGSGFWTRFTVHYNLFAGTVVALGDDSQVQALREAAPRGELGCFALTERLAGVNSGLVVHTVAEYLPERGAFRLYTPDEANRKHWISAGLTADRAVVVADLLVGGQRRGPHAFVVDMKAPGVVAGDMGEKSVFNDLDNAWISFEDVLVPRQDMLSRYARVTAGGEYVADNAAGLRTMELVGQRLFTGRVAVAQAALVFSRALFKKTRAFSDTKPRWVPGGRKAVLSDVPQLAALYREADQELASLEQYVGQVEAELSRVLLAGEIPPESLQRAVAVAKVASVEGAIALCWRLKQDVGSYALMAGSGFEFLDALQCMKFAEGDSRVLMNKMARDTLSTLQRGPALAAADDSAGAESPGTQEVALGRELAASLKEARKGGSRQEAWDANHELVYKLADATVKRTLRSWAGAARSRL